MRGVAADYRAGAGPIRGPRFLAGLLVAGTTVALAGFLLSSASAQAAGCATNSVAFGYTGAEQCYVVPAGVTEVRVVAVGAPGTDGYTNGRGVVPAAGLGGEGAQVSGVLAVTPAEVLYVEVGGTGGYFAQAFNGGGSGASEGALGGGPGGGAGGGASDVRTVSCGTVSR